MFQPKPITESSIVVSDNHIFADTTARDAYFVTNPGELVDNLPVYITGTSSLQQYKLATTTWLDITPTIQGPTGPQGATGATGQGVPTGGSIAQALVKSSGTNYDTEWATLNEVPSGGNDGQVLAKASATDYDTEWIDVVSSGGTWGTITGTLANQTDLNNALTAKISTSLIGVANGVAELNESGIVISTQLPSYVDDVVEYANLGAFPTTGESGKIYFDLAEDDSYRWGGTAYIPIISGGVTLGETSDTAYRGDRGATAYTHSQAPHAPSNAQKNSDITKGEIEAKLTGEISSHSHAGGGGTATLTTVVTTGFANNLSSADDTVQKALDTIDNLTISAGAHASTHISTGADAIADAVAGGASGLMSGSDKTKLDGIASGAEVNVQADWNASSGDAQILNKPSIPAAQVQSDWNATEGMGVILNKPSIPSPYTLPTATADVLGGVKIGSGITITDGVISASGSSLPAQTGNSGKYLTTDGTNASWATVSVGASSEYITRTLEGVVYETTLMYWVCPATATISSAQMYLSSNPSATGSFCKVQVMKNGLLETNSIFNSDAAMYISETSSTNTAGIYYGTVAAFDTGNSMNSLAAGDTLFFRVNQADTGSADLLVQMKVTFT